MTRICFVALILLSLCGCQALRPDLNISQEQAEALNLRLTGGITASISGDIFLTTPGNLQQYNPRSRELTSLLNDAIRIEDVAVTSDNVLLALRSESLCAAAAGYLTPIHDLPGQAYALSCDREFAYILTKSGQGTQLIRYHLTGNTQGQIDPMLAIADHPQALCAVRGGCLVASGGNLIKVTDPMADQVATALLVAIESPITSVVADQSRLIVYFCTQDTTFAWIDGQIIPIFPAGNRLAWAQDTLTICQAAQTNSQIIQIPTVSQHTKTLLSKLVPTSAKGNAS